MFQGQTLRVTPLAHSGLFELCFDRVGDLINKFDERTVSELRDATNFLHSQAGLRGVLVTSAKSVFIVGADITEFGEKFTKPAEVIASGVSDSNRVFVQFEDLPVPTVVAINGYALGGGLEFALANSIRVMATTAHVGVPEVKLGLFPGFGGTVRLSRVAGPAVACEWVTSGRPANGEEALEAGVVDALAPLESLRATALTWLHNAVSGELDWSSRQRRKLLPVALPPADLENVFQAAAERVTRTSPPHQPAAAMAVAMMRDAAPLARTGALALEAKVFGEVARTQAGASLVQAFLNDQALKKQVKRQAKLAPPVLSAAVLGAGIMGGGIAFASALKGVPVRIKDIRAEALESGMVEVRKQIARREATGRLSNVQGAEVLARVKTQTDNAGFSEMDLVVEAIVEDLDIKRQVLVALEQELTSGTVIASNTSSLRIDHIGEPLERPQHFVGMHFFNPVPMMPLVEIVRGAQTDDATVAKAVGFAVRMGKTPIVVKDCPGFLVNRLLTAYMRSFLHLVAEGADFVKVDRAMESFGWPMGPAYLEDVVGIDTGSHVNNVISAGYPERMPPLVDDALSLMAREGRYGQKNGIGFYQYEPNAKGKPTRAPANDSHALLARLQPHGPREFSEAQIVERMMLPMIVEAAHAVEEGVVASAAELDTAMLLGLGFPAYAGGPLQYADWIGLQEVVARCNRLSDLGPAYQPTQRMREMASGGGRFHMSRRASAHY